MKRIGDMETYSLDELLDRDLGKVGTPERDVFEAELESDIQAYRLGEAVKEARLSQNLTQMQLSKKVGVNQAQISRLETGKSVPFGSMKRVFRALGFKPATMDVAGFGKLALW